MSLILNSGFTIGPGVILSTVRAPTGLTSSDPSTSAWQIKQDYPASTDGLYWIQNTTINSGAPFQIYADMTTLGGGWTLLVQNTYPEGWDFNTTVLLRTTTPPTTLATYNGSRGSEYNYSILGWADAIKRSPSGFDYMFDAGYRGRNGAAYTANEAYSFVETYSSQTMGDAGLQGHGGTIGWRKNITEIERFPAGAPEDTATWNYDQDSVEARMPWFSYGVNANGSLTTDGYNNGWWGTLISYDTNQWDPAPWMSGGFSNGLTMDPGNSARIIWYWVR